MQTPRWAVVTLAIAILALHLPFLPAALEDLDSINFALGVRHFDVSQHQPHPPGYPVYIAVAKVVHAVGAEPTRALALVSVVAAVAAVFGLVPLATVLLDVRRPTGPPLPLMGTVLIVSAPLFSITALRPLSDMFGFAAAIAIQAWTLRSRSVGAIAAAAFAAGLAVGIRSQVVWLTAPLLVCVLWGWRRERPALVSSAVAAVLVAYVAGALVWFAPLIALSGGPAAYLRVLSQQGSEDFAGVAMLATQPSPRLLLSALRHTLVAPWGGPWLGVPVLMAAALGAGVAVRHARSRGALLAAFGPYMLFHLIFQETATTRYALPLVVPVGLLATLALARLPRPGDVVAVAALVTIGLTVAQPARVGYASAPAPAFRVLADMHAAAPEETPVLAMHRRQELDLRRPLHWNSGRLPRWRAHLPAPPKHEWLELVKYWNGGGRAPVWFLGDPPRSDLRLIDPRAVHLKGTYRWSFDATAVLGGVRPDVMDWYRIDPPGWYAGEGWSLTPETAGLARAEGRGPGQAPIQAWIRRHDSPVVLMIGGRHLGPAGAATLTAAIDGTTVWSRSVHAGFFLEFVSLGPGGLAGAGDYATLTIASDSDEVAIEQFDTQPADQPLLGYGDGWHETEYNPRTGEMWRWTSERAVLRVRTPRRPLSLHVEGEYDGAGPAAHLTFRAAERILAEHDVNRLFALDIAVPPDAIEPEGELRLTLESDKWYVPAETHWRPTQDRRRLALRVFHCAINNTTPAHQDSGR
ncbi:MAG: hypothetical protein AB7N65_16730 [Vicinamibacterales bacterium]